MEFECSCRHFTNNFEKTASNGMCWCLASCLFQNKWLMYLYRPQQAFLMRLENPTTKLSSQVKSVIMTPKKRAFKFISEIYLIIQNCIKRTINRWKWEIPDPLILFRSLLHLVHDMFMSSCTWARPFSPSSLKSPCLHPTPSLSCHWWLVDIEPKKIMQIRLSV